MKIKLFEKAEYLENKSKKEIINALKNMQEPNRLLGGKQSLMEKEVVTRKDFFTGQPYPYVLYNHYCIEHDISLVEKIRYNDVTYTWRELKNMPIQLLKVNSFIWGLKVKHFYMPRRLWESKKEYNQRHEEEE
jgi:hypothetical protein